jgi:hypothetical protein
MENAETKRTEEKPKHGIPDIFWHHGTCDLCHDNYVLVCHFGYQAKTAQEPSYRLCKNCMYDRIEYILYGSHDYDDALIIANPFTRRRLHNDTAKQLE